MIARAAYAFFRAHAGGIVGENALGALRLARAEAYARAQVWRVEWDYDPDPDFGDHAHWCDVARRLEAGRYPDGSEIGPGARGRGPRCEHTTEVATLFDDDDNVLASCGGILDADASYRRTMAAELASEALANVQRARHHDNESAHYMAL